MKRAVHFAGAGRFQAGEFADVVVGWDCEQLLVELAAARGPSGRRDRRCGVGKGVWERVDELVEVVALCWLVGEQGDGGGRLVLMVEAAGGSEDAVGVDACEVAGEVVCESAVCLFELFGADRFGELPVAVGVSGRAAGNDHRRLVREPVELRDRVGMVDFDEYEL